MANSKGGHLEISANAGFPGGSVPAVRAQGALTVTSQSGDFTTYLAEQGLTPISGCTASNPPGSKESEGT